MKTEDIERLREKFFKECCKDTRNIQKSPEEVFNFFLPYLQEQSYTVQDILDYAAEKEKELFSQGQYIAKLPVLQEPKEEEKKEEVKGIMIESDGLCGCLITEKCPLGKSAAQRCTRQELNDNKIFTYINKD